MMAYWKRSSSSVWPLHLAVVVLGATLLLCAPAAAWPSWQKVGATIKEWAKEDGKWHSANTVARTQLIPAFEDGVRAALDPDLWTAQLEVRFVTVSQDGTGDFRTVAEAVHSAEKAARRTVIKVGPGVYRENVVVTAGNKFVTLCGDPVAMPTIAARREGEATVRVLADYFVSANIIFKATQGQALHISGDKAAFYNCAFMGQHNTLFDETGMHFFRDCIISGAVDFIYGNGVSLYSHCTIDLLPVITNMVAPPQRLSSGNAGGGLSFVSCNVRGPVGQVWMPSSAVTFAKTYLGVPIKTKGRNVSVFKCMGPGMDATGIRVLTDELAKPFLSMNLIHAGTWLLPVPSYY